MPIRIQRKRSKGWRKPTGAVNCTRPGPYGNPFTVRAYWDAGYSGSYEVATRHCVEAYRAWLKGEKYWAHGHMTNDMERPDIEPLRGHDLMCWCSVGSPCHVDVLLELANA